MKIKRILLNNIGLKLLALLFAFVTWFYIEGAIEIDSDKTVLQKIFSPSNYIAKKLYVKPIFVGNVPDGYRFLKDGVKTTPEFYELIGPSKFLSNKEFIYTKPIDLSEHTISKTMDVELKSISRAIRFQKIKTKVFLPVEKIGQKVEE